MLDTTYIVAIDYSKFPRVTRYQENSSTIKCVKNDSRRTNLRKQAIHNQNGVIDDQAHRLPRLAQVRVHLQAYEIINRLLFPATQTQAPRAVDTSIRSVA